MTDLEMTKLAAEAMGLTVGLNKYIGNWYTVDKDHPNEAIPYDPLHGDAQMVALVKKFRLLTMCEANIWLAMHGKVEARNADLNRAVVECVAKLQSAKVKP